MLVNGLDKLQVSYYLELLNYDEITFVPGPAKQRWASTGEGHDPSKAYANDGMLLSKTKCGHRLTHHNVALDSQNYQGPQANLTY